MFSLFSHFSPQISWTRMVIKKKKKESIFFNKTSLHWDWNLNGQLSFGPSTQLYQQMLETHLSSIYSHSPKNIAPLHHVMMLMEPEENGRISEQFNQFWRLRTAKAWSWNFMALVIMTAHKKPSFQIEYVMSQFASKATSSSTMLGRPPARPEHLSSSRR